MINDDVRRLEEKQAELARAALQTPAARTEFEYGRVCGIYAGLDLAKDLLLNAAADKDAKDNNL